MRPEFPKSNGVYHPDFVGLACRTCPAFLGLNRHDLSVGSSAGAVNNLDELTSYSNTDLSAIVSDSDPEHAAANLVVAEADARLAGSAQHERLRAMNRRLRSCAGKTALNHAEYDALNAQVTEVAAAVLADTERYPHEHNRQMYATLAADGLVERLFPEPCAGGLSRSV
jgi:hypothetical protein